MDPLSYVAGYGFPACATSGILRKDWRMEARHLLGVAGRS
jgi:hypothetical protein